jgi:hypothetical protein
MPEVLVGHLFSSKMDSRLLGNDNIADQFFPNFARR